MLVILMVCFGGAPVKPNFTKVSGIWNERGTFIPNN